MLSPWASLRRGGVIPLDKQASQVQYRHHIIYETDLSILGLTGQVVHGRWHVQRKRGDEIRFDQEVDLAIYIVSWGFVGQTFFTWAFRQETITTHVVDGQQITEENPSWKYTVGGTPLSEFGTLIPGGGGDYTNLTATIITRWEGPVYIENVQPGETWHILLDSWGLGVSSRPEYQFRFQFGSRRMAEAKFGMLDELIQVKKLGTSSLITGHSWPGYQYPVWLGYIADASDPSMVVYDNGIQILGVMLEDGYYEHISKDSGRSWTKVKYPTENPLVDEEKEVFSKDARMPQLIRTDNYRLALAIVNSDLRVRRIRDEGMDASLTIGQVANDETFSFDRAPTGEIYIVSSTGEIKFKSSDDGLTYEIVSGDTDGDQ